ncbi:hypothetical protein RB195_005985 [Necator americanus]|uniref:Small ribosomal subunit protein mS23 n=2 Tax=Necator americanus TaxID=51031 RepID=A0ABR1BU95_NECAM
MRIQGRAISARPSTVAEVRKVRDLFADFDRAPHGYCKVLSAGPLSFMASSITRAERSGNIFYRITGLIRSGQLVWAERPLWYDVYIAHPPLEAHDWNTKHPKYDEPVRKIFYSEDIVRAAFYKKYRGGVINLEHGRESLAQQFINECEAVKSEQEGKENLTHDELFRRTEQRMKDLGVELK